MTKKLNPPKRYREATEKQNCGNCGHKEFYSQGFTVIWYTCSRPSAGEASYTNFNFVCNGHKEAK